MVKGRRADNTMVKGRRTDNTMVKGRRSDNTMVKGRRTDNTMIKGRRTDNTMIKGRRSDNTMILSVLPFSYATVDCKIYSEWRKTFERIYRTKERNKTDIRATTCNPFERKCNNPLERDF